jgi:hypothetical protein
VGGTALSLQLGHRISDDIDLFTREDIEKEEILDFLNSNYKEDFQINNIQAKVLQITVTDIKVDFVRYDYNLIENIKEENGIRYLGKRDIAAMKLLAVANRGDQAKDFIDIFYLLKEFPLSEMFNFYKQKFCQKDVSIIKRSLTYFDDVTDSNWASVKLLNDKISADEVKHTIIDEVKKYNGRES